MSCTQTITLHEDSLQKSTKYLSVTSQIWFVVMAIGQIAFVIHILTFYGGSALQGNLAKWNEHLYHGIITGDSMGNVALAGHLLMAFMITAGGLLQLLPITQNRFIHFHRWNGRMYVVVAFLISVAGSILVLSRGVVGGVWMSSGNLTNAVLIMITAALTWRTAMKRQMKQHRKWALRLFLFVSGVWFFRIAFGFWILINQGAPGHTNMFDGPFDIFLAIAHTSLPVFFLELYFKAQESTKPILKWIMGSSLLILTLMIAAGISMATIIFWIP